MGGHNLPTTPHLPLSFQEGTSGVSVLEIGLVSVIISHLTGGSKRQQTRSAGGLFYGLSGNYPHHGGVGVGVGISASVAVGTVVAVSVGVGVDVGTDVAVAVEVAVAVDGCCPCRTILGASQSA